MQPVVTVAEMAAMDAAALRTTTHDVLVRRAGHAVAIESARLLGEVRGRRVTVIAGRGTNGADGRVAARELRVLGAVVEMVDPDVTSDALVGADLVIDAAYGTGLNRPFAAPEPPAGARVLAVDLPSGLDGDVGSIGGGAMEADSTVTMAAIKAGLLVGEGPRVAGRLVRAEIGISTHDASMALIEDHDLATLPRRARGGHKWASALTVVAGAPGMEGAAILAALGAMHSGAGMVRLVHPSGDVQSGSWPIEVVRRAVSLDDLVSVAACESERCGAMVVGPGLGTDPGVASAIRSIVSERSCPVVLDADGLAAAEDLDGLARLVAAASSPVVITPHDGELRRLLGDEGDLKDRVATLRHVAMRTGATVLSKGATTIVVGHEAAFPTVAFVNAGTTALATAGTGDVLSGIIGSLLAQGVGPAPASALGAHLHGRAGSRASGVLVASELPALVGLVVSEVHRAC